MCATLVSEEVQRSAPTARNCCEMLTIIGDTLHTIEMSTSKAYKARGENLWLEHGCALGGENYKEMTFRDFRTTI